VEQGSLRRAKVLLQWEPDPSALRRQLPRAAMVQGSLPWGAQVSLQQAHDLSAAQRQVLPRAVS
jgi:hypothetical protein